MFDVFQERVELPPLSGMVLNSQISGRNKKPKFPTLIHKACCYLVLFFLTVYSCYYSLLFTVSINFSVYPQHLHTHMGHGTQCYVPRGGMTSNRV